MTNILIFILSVLVSIPIHKKYEAWKTWQYETWNNNNDKEGQ